MTDGVVAAVDLGATSGRVMVGHVGPDTLRLEQSARFRNDPVALRDGLHWDILGLFGAAEAGLRAAVRSEPGIVSIGVDSWAVDYALLRDGSMLDNPFHYRDARTARGVEGVHARVPHTELYARNGLQFLPFNTVYQLAAERPSFLAFADRLLLIPDLFAFWFTGAERAEATNASTTGLFGVRDGAWDVALLDTLGLPAQLLAPIIRPGESYGPLEPAFAARIGASSHVGVTAVGSHDTASAVVAVPMRAEAAAYISCGTWGLVGVEVEHPVLSADALAANFTNELGVDGRIRLLHNVMGLWILSESVRTWEREGHRIDLPTLLDSAEEVATPVPIFDVNDPRFLAPGDMPARIGAWCAERGIAAPRTRAEFARSIIESLAQGFADAVVDAARIGGVDVRTIHIVGGGALNGLLCQRTADRAGIPVLAGPVEATALGNVLVQGRAAGLLPGSLDALRDLVSRTHAPRLHSPRAENSR